MASFAPGTSQQYINDYYSRAPRSLGGQVPDDQHPQGLPRSPSRPASWYSGPSSSPYNPSQSQGMPAAAQKPQAGPDMSAYTPSKSAGMRWAGSEWQLPAASSGKAQPVQPQSQGTPYGQPDSAVDAARRNMELTRGLVYSHSQPPQQQAPGRYAYGTTPEYMAQNPDTPMPPPRSPGYGPGWPAGLPQNGPREVTKQPAGRTPWNDDLGSTAGLPVQFLAPPSVTPGGGLGNLAYSPPENRPQPFTTSMRGPDGQQYDPGRFFPMRDAFIQNINDARSAFAANPSRGRPRMDFGGMWNRAGQMAQDGYSNPLAQLLGGNAAMPGRQASAAIPSGQYSW